MRADIEAKVKPAHCRYCASPIGGQHTEECIGTGLVEPEMVLQLGGLPPLMLSGEDLTNAKLALFIYRLLRDGNPGEVERSAIEAEASHHHTHMEISNRLLFMYAENIAQRMQIPAGPIPGLTQEVRVAIEDLLSLAGRLGRSYETYGGVDLSDVSGKVRTFLDGAE